MLIHTDRDIRIGVPYTLDMQTEDSDIGYTLILENTVGNDHEKHHMAYIATDLYTVDLTSLA